MEKKSLLLQEMSRAYLLPVRIRCTKLKRRGICHTIKNLGLFEICIAMYTGVNKDSLARLKCKCVCIL